MKSYSSAEIIKLLVEAGWYEVYRSGSHLHMKHRSKPGKITVPHPRKDLTAKTLHSIIKHAELTLPE